MDREDKIDMALSSICDLMINKERKKKEIRYLGRRGIKNG